MFVYEYYVVGVVVLDIVGEVLYLVDFEVFC